MNIGVDIRPLMTGNRTGVGEYTFELLNAILKIDHNNQYFLFYNSYSDVASQIPRWQYDNVHYVSTHYPNKLFNASQIILSQPKLDKYIIQNTKYQIQKLDFFFSPNLNFTSLSTTARRLLTIHDLSFEFYPEFYTPKQRLWHQIINPKKQCQRADIILTPSENTKRDVVKHYKINAEKIKVIYPGANQESRIKNQESAIKQYGLPKNFILFLGTIEPRKNIIGLIEAFELMSQNTKYKILNTSHSLVIAGAPGWNSKEIFARIQLSPCRDKIKYIGYVAPEYKSALYAAADLFVYPSFYEGFGFPVLEAMATGTPVITSNRSSLPEISTNAAYLINPHRSDEIALGMERILNNDQLKNRLFQNGLLQAQKFNWETAARQWLDLLSL